MHFEFDDTETDYLHRVLLMRPMGEVEPLVLKIRQQVAKQQQLKPELVKPASEDANLEALP